MASRLVDHGFSPAAELDVFLAELVEEGAVVSFVGVARPLSRDGSRVERLYLDHHPRLTPQSMDTIVADALRAFDIASAHVVHRSGEVPPGEAVVFVAAAARHRRAAFDAADYLMDRLKTEAVFWKREESESGSAWIEPTNDDRRARARWSDRCPE